MTRKAVHKTARAAPAATAGYEARRRQRADALRGSMDAAEYKHFVLGLIFLKHISDAFEEQPARLEAEQAAGAEPEDPDEYCASPACTSSVCAIEHRRARRHRQYLHRPARPALTRHMHLS